jgi:hypothetical protein
MRNCRIVFAFIVAACARGETPPADSAAVTTEPAVVTITARDFSFTMPDTIQSGVTKVVLVNEGPNLHHAQLVRLDDGKTFADVEAALKAGGPPPAWVHDMGGPGAPPTGGSASATTNLQPGNYAVICFVDLPDRMPHYAKGMAKGFVVVQGTSTAVEPTPTITMTIADYSFATDTTLTAGPHVVKVVNNGPQVHEVVVFKLDSAKTVDDFIKFGETYQGAPPGQTMGGIVGVRPGDTHYFDLNLTPGNYLLLCFVPDSKDGKPHIVHGMMQPFTIQ